MSFGGSSQPAILSQDTRVIIVGNHKTEKDMYIGMQGIVTRAQPLSFRRDYGYQVLLDEVSMEAQVKLAIDNFKLMQPNPTYSSTAQLKTPLPPHRVRTSGTSLSTRWWQ
jgi:hypothetical protein